MYCTLTDITAVVPEETVIQLTDDAAAGVVNTAMVDKAIADASAEVDSYCAARYTVPFATVPAILVKVAADIAVYNLYSRLTETVPETRKDRYKNAIRLLENIARGVVSLGETPAPPTTSQAAATVTGNGRLFTRETLRDM